jgi:uncharacterized protein YegJ (DUF2314 family)
MGRSRSLIIGGLVAVAAAIAYFAWLASAKPSGPRNLVRVTDPGPRLTQAIERARRELPTFEQALAKGSTDDRFAVRGMFGTGAQREYLWIANPITDGSYFVGRLDQTPVLNRDLKAGQVVRVRRADVVDWLMIRNGRREGGYTEDVLGRNAR